MLNVDKEFRDLFPQLTEDEFNQLEKNIIKDGCQSPIITWKGYVVDGHNRYNICTKHDIKYQTDILTCSTKDEAIEWMIDNQLGRRNLTPIQKIAIAEKYRSIFEKKAKRNQIRGGGDRKSYLKKTPKILKPINTREELAKIAGVSHDTYDKGTKILASDNEQVKQKVINGEMKINTAYNEIFNNKLKNRKAIPQTTIKHLINRTNGKCEICGWGGIGLEAILIPHHKNKYSITEDNSIENLAMICPNYHNIIHTLENCKDKAMSEIIKGNINIDIVNKINYYVEALEL
jgi:hypothetical protein